MSQRTPLLCLVVAALVLPLVLAAPARGAGRAVKDIDSDLNKAYDGANVERQKLVGKEAAAMAGEAPKVRKFVDLLEERLVAAPQEAGVVRPALYAMLTTLAILDEDAARKRLEADVKSAVAATSACGNVALASVAWHKAYPDEAAQLKQVEAIKAIAKANPREDAIAMIVGDMISARHASNAHRTALARIIIEDLRGPDAVRIAQRMAMMIKRTELEGKPLAIRGTATDGKAFSSDAYKGKVVLVDFWSSASPPSREELARTVKLYAAYRAKGLEIVGISADASLAAVKDYVKQTPGMTWVQLYQAGAGGNTLLKTYYVSAVPTMFLIDRNGVCRTVEARGNAEAMIAELLKEQPGEKK